jgi:hypothetical protein
LSREYLGKKFQLTGKVISKFYRGGRRVATQHLGREHLRIQKIWGEKEEDYCSFVFPSYPWSLSQQEKYPGVAFKLLQVHLNLAECQSAIPLQMGSCQCLTIIPP